MKRYLMTAVLLALSLLAWWAGKSAEREADRLEHYAAGVPTADVVIPPPGTFAQPVIADIPVSTFEFVNGEMVPSDPKRREADGNAEVYRSASQWGYRMAWAAPLFGVLTLCLIVRKRKEG